MKKYQNREEALLTKKEDYLRSASIMYNCEADDIRIIGTKLTEQEARDKLKTALEMSSAPLNLGVDAKLIEKINNAGTPIVHKEYYSVITSWFHISEIEYDYSYRLNGNLININPKKANTDMDFCVSVETLDGRYKQSIAGNRTDLEIWDDITEEECVDDFEDGFSAHAPIAEDEIRESHESMKILNRKLYARVKELKQEELGVSRRIDELNIIDKKYSFTSKVLVAPFYIFNYDLGTQIVTISVDAYSGTIGTPIVNNPLGLAVLAKTDNNIEPTFSIPICIICGIVCIGLGAALYALYYFYKKMKYKSQIGKPRKVRNMDLPSYSFEELKKLM